jgi:hypothetical protein
VAYFGTVGAGLNIRHNSSHAYYRNYTGSHVFENNAADNQLVVAQQGGQLQ